ncbi:DUF397 domain-containing protein [Streptomyces sp. NPDC093970]|uniref:DUF397 domain-containing protein n=1 Tax=Streptomyces sp. NPDC093970 TaxID=3155076 RepID=UPI003435CD71
MIRKASAGNPSELAWFKSSYSSGPDGDSCVEVALTWFKSTYSAIAPTPAAIHIRDSKHASTAPGGPRLALAPSAWVPFVAYAAGN